MVRFDFDQFTLFTIVSYDVMYGVLSEEVQEKNREYYIDNFLLTGNSSGRIQRVRLTQGGLSFDFIKNQAKFIKLANKLYKKAISNDLKL